MQERNFIPGNLEEVSIKNVFFYCGVDFTSNNYLGLCDSSPEMQINTGPRAGAGYFHKLLDGEISRIQGLCNEWNLYKVLLYLFEFNLLIVRNRYTINLKSIRILRHLTDFQQNSGHFLNEWLMLICMSMMIGLNNVQA